MHYTSAGLERNRAGRKALVKHVLLLLPVPFLLSILLPLNLSGQSQTFTSSGTFTVPAGVNSIVVECWGGGGAGGGTTTNNARGGGGGAGGAYARVTLSVNGGEVFTVTVGGAGVGAQSAGATGNPSWFGNTTLVFAQGGAGGAAPNGGTAPGGAGSNALSIGDVVIPGGNGANGTTALSGGGGGGAGSGGAGGNASGTTAGTGAAENGGNGGTGRTTGGNGSAGTVYGSGGGGAFVNSNTNRTGGSGTQGLVVVSWTASQKFTASGNFTVPAGVTSIIVEGWGGGGAGGGNGTVEDGGGGGGGGAYSRKTLTVVPGTVYPFVVGAGGAGGSNANGAPGGDTYFGTAALFLAKGGSGGARAAGGVPGAGGAGGSAALSVGDLKFSGGNGGRGRDNATGQGGPGGSSAGTSANGVSGPDPFSTTTAGAPPPGGGRGGNGGGAGASGLPGLLPGGGGGGSGDGTVSGGNGSGGQIIIFYDPPVFYSQNSGDPAVTANWRTSGGHNPANFATAGQKFIIQNGHTMTTTSTGWSVGGARSVVEIQNGGTLTETFSASFAADTDLKINNGGVLNHNVNTVTIFSGGKIFEVNSFVIYGLAGAQVVVTTDYGNLTLAGSGLKTIASTAVVNGILTLEGTATASAAPTYGASASLRYAGTASRTTGPEFITPFIAGGGVIADNTAGVSLDAGRTINTKLTFINGRINTGAFTLTMGADADITGAGTGKYVNGTLRHDVGAATPSITFEIGDASQYAPVTILFNGATNGTGNIVAQTLPGDHPNIATSAINSSLSVNRYWNLTNNGVSGFTSMDAGFGFNESDKDSGTDFNYFIAGLFSGGVWTYPATGTKTTVSLGLTGLTGLGGFQIGQMVSDFRSAASGNWNQNSTWQVFAGGSWIPAPVTPSSASGSITLRSPDIITLNTAVAIDQVSVAPGATLGISSNVTLDNGPGDDMVVNGTVEIAGGFSVSGNGSFILSPGATLKTGSVSGITSSGAAGSITTTTRSFSSSANYEYNGTSAQSAGNGLPSMVSNLIINNTAGVSLASGVAISGELRLTQGVFSTGPNNLTFLASNIPLTRTLGSLSLHPSASLFFGTAGVTGGASFTLPDNLFALPAETGNLTIFRAAGITLNNQQLGVKNIVLCHGPLNTSGNLILLSDASSTALIDGSGTGAISGIVTMQRYLPSAFGYKYISSPFQSAPVSELADDINLGSPFPSLYRYEENRAGSGWMSYINLVNILNPLRGYSAQFGTSGTPFTADISGTVNNGTLSVTLYNNNQPFTKGFNLVGNPYPSPVNWDAPSGWTKTNIDNALYFFRAGTTDQYGGTYRTYINGISSDGIVSGIIPSMQGFFVHVSDGAYPVTGTLALNNSVRVSNFSQPFTKSSNSDSRNYLRLVAGFTDDSLSADPTVIYFDEKATKLMDGQADALKLFNTDLTVPNIYSVTDDNYKLSVNGLPPVAEPLIQVPLGIRTNRSGLLEVSLHSADEETRSKGIFLKDVVTGVTHNLTFGAGYRVTLPVNEFTGRFFLLIGSEVTGITDDLQSGEPMIRLYESEGVFVAEIGQKREGKGIFSIYNITGQLLFRRNVVFPCRLEQRFGLNQGIYFGVLEEGGRRHTGKFITGVK